MPQQQARYWILTIPMDDWVPPTGPLVEPLTYLRGQGELGASGYRHWQVIAYFRNKVTLRQCKSFFTPTTHAEPTKSKRAESYVWKEETAIADTKFELGSKSIKRNSSRDWEQIWESAKNGSFMDIPADVRVRCLSSLLKVRGLFSVCEPMEKQVTVYWGCTGVGKSYRAWSEAGPGAYPKDPLSKWWDGYNGESSVIIDEFRGIIAIAHLLRWFDHYPVRVEIKGGSVPLRANRIFITSNLDPAVWYPDLDAETYNALRRRIRVIHMSEPFRSINSE